MKKILFYLSKTAVLGSLFLGCVNTTFADESSSMMNQLKGMVKKIEEMQNLLLQQQTEIEKLKIRNSSLEKGHGEADTVNINAPTVSRPTTGLTAFNPEIGAVADMTAMLTESKEDAEGNDALSIREVELIFGSDVDPFSRFDSTIAVTENEGVELEEAYLTHWGLPLGIKGKLGKMHPGIGKVLPLHRDQLELADEPLVIQDYFGIEGMSNSGLELSTFSPLESDLFTQEVKLGVMSGGIGEEGSLLGSTKRRPSFYGHVKNFFDISDNTTFELGASYLTGSADETSSFDVNVYALDATLIHYVDSNNRFTLQSEIFFQDRDKPAFLGEEADLDTRFNESPYGLYVLADYRYAQNWGTGFRYDYVQPVNYEVDSLQDNTEAYSIYATYYQSEYARFRLQYQHVDMNDFKGDDRFIFQGTFAIGVHKHQLQ